MEKDISTELQNLNKRVDIILALLLANDKSMKQLNLGESVLRLEKFGFSNKEIARLLEKTENSVKVSKSIEKTKNEKREKKT